MDDQQIQHLSDEDINKLCDKLCDRIENRLYTNIGSGIMGLLWRGILIAIIAIASYGFLGHTWKL